MEREERECLVLVKWYLGGDRELGQTLSGEQ